MNSIVSYPDRGIGGSNKYRGNCSPRLIEDLIKQYKLKEISDYMCGSNTTKDVGERFNIKTNTYDLNIGFDLINDEIKETGQNFIFWHPPYWDIIKYSGNMYGNTALENDISQIKDYEEFMRIANELLFKQFATLKTGGRMAILMADVKKKGKLYSMLLDFIKPDTVENIVIKAQHNCWSDRVDYGNKNFIPIVHEYLLILRRDNPYIQTLKITKDYSFDIRDSKSATWKDIIYSIFEKEKKPLSLRDIYDRISKNKKALNNKHYKEKIRQTLRSYDRIFECTERGVYKIVEDTPTS